MSKSGRTTRTRPSERQGNHTHSCVSARFPISHVPSLDRSDPHFSSHSPPPPSLTTTTTTTAVWWFGTAMNAVGELGNLIAYGYAESTVVAPIGAVGVLCSALIATFVLGEPFRFETSTYSILSQYVLHTGHWARDRVSSPSEQKCCKISLPTERIPTCLPSP